MTITANAISATIHERGWRANMLDRLIEESRENVTGFYQSHDRDTGRLQRKSRQPVSGRRRLRCGKSRGARNAIAGQIFFRERAELSGRDRANLRETRPRPIERLGFLLGEIQDGKPVTVVSERVLKGGEHWLTRPVKLILGHSFLGELICEINRELRYF